MLQLMWKFMVEPYFMIFRFLFECEEALQASVSNRIIIYPLTDSTLTPAHDDPSPSPHQPASSHTSIHDAADWDGLSEEPIVPCTTPAASWHCTAQQTLCSSYSWRQ